MQKGVPLAIKINCHETKVRKKNFKKSIKVIFRR